MVNENYIFFYILLELITIIFQVSKGQNVYKNILCEFNVVYIDLANPIIN